MCYVPSPQMSLKPQLWQPWYKVFDLKDRDDIYGIVLVACVQIIDKQRGGDEQPAGEMVRGWGGVGLCILSRSQNTKHYRCMDYTCTSYLHL